MNTLTPNQANIRKLIFDYLEGTLDQLTTAKLLEAIRQNPEWATELDQMQQAILTRTPAKPFDTTRLYRSRTNKSITADSFDEFAIAYTEELLNPQQIGEFESFLATHPDKQKDLVCYQKARIIADNRMVYPNKKGLKQPTGRRVPMRMVYTSLAVAASIALLFVVYRPQPAVQTTLAIAPAPSPADTTRKFTIAQAAPGASAVSDTEHKTKPQAITDTAQADTLGDIDYYTPEPRLMASIPASQPSPDGALQVSVIPALPISAPRFWSSQLDLAKNAVASFKQKQATGLEPSSLLQKGVSQLANLTGTDIRLEYRKNAAGKIDKVEFSSPLIAYETTFRRNR